SGHFSTPALACAMAELGADRVMFSVDWPFVANEPAVAWAQGLDLPEPALGGLLGANARRLLKLA
ncbi:amidohydrolase family protein, partial [Bacillus sp. SIMBA_006]|uniref:amidohydrolase family protein n=1 Tax=Bacillus sp. SIMBA_006 TaxID=3085755 RepID=UPI0039788FE4